MNTHFASFAKHDFIRILALTSRTHAAKGVFHRPRLDEWITHICASKLTTIKLRFFFLTFSAETFHAPASSSPSFFIFGRFLQGLPLTFANCFLLWQSQFNFFQKLLDELPVDVR
jgi:hypothetical protein